MTFDYSQYLSPFTWRYGSEEMRSIWSEENKRKLWRRIWVALASAQHEQGLISSEELQDLIKHQDSIDIEKAHEIEKETHHDLMAEINVYATQAKIGGGKLHLGATSMDIEDNADALRIQESLTLVEKKVQTLLDAFAQKIEQYKNTPCMAYTHLQPAEPTTLGYRFCLYATDLLMDLRLLSFAKKELKGKGMKGAVGTSASYSALLGEKNVTQMEDAVMKQLGIEAAAITGQTSPRKMEFFVAESLSSIAQSLYKFATDLRIMQSPGFSEWQEPFGKKQVGSSAMPFKKNPWRSEHICSLARLVMHQAAVPGENAANMLFERTLDDSANRRIVLPELFLAIDNILDTALPIVNDMIINEKQIQKNLTKFGPFAATEAIMMQAVKKGADRQAMHEVLRENAMLAWDAVQNDKENPLASLLQNDARITKYLSREEVETHLDPKTHLGLAPQACLDFLKQLHDEVSS